MIDILFKGQRISDGELIEGALLPSDDEVRIATSYLGEPEDDIAIMVATYRVDPETIYQYKGLTDKNGNMVWEKYPTPNTRLKIQEYIGELNKEIDRCVSWVEENMSGEACKVTAMESRIETLTEVKNDLQSRLEEVI